MVCRRRGVYTKHAHPQDCRQYFLCIEGEAREYGCPLGSVFKINTDGTDGVCDDPKDVPECVNYYGDLKFDTDELVRAGVDPEVVGIKPAKTNSGKVHVILQGLLKELFSYFSLNVEVLPKNAKNILLHGGMISLNILVSSQFFVA